VQRVETYKPTWPLPKLFRLTKGGALIEGIFAAETINTPSMLAVEDALDGLRWAEGIGGLKGLIARAELNLDIVEAWVERAPWGAFLAAEPATRSCTSVCLTIEDPAFTALPDAGRQTFVKELTGLLAKEGVAYDIASYRDAPAGLRIWCGATVEAADLSALTPWLDWAFAEVRSRHGRAAA
jgi:phosphoserine aminotransferase